MIGSITELQSQLAKAYSDRGITPGPGEGTDPGEPRPENFDRPYIDAGHGAESPQSELPRTNPLPMLQPGMPQTIALSPRVMAAQIPNHIVSSYSLGSPSDR